MLDYTNKKVLIMGLGLNQGGVGAVRFFLKQRARVSVTDIKPRRFLLPSVRKISEFQKKLGTSVQPVRYILGRHQKRDFTNADIVIKGPGVSQNSPFLKLLRKRRIPIETDVGIFFKYCPAPIIGITGSKGKSTTASLIADILRGISSDVVLAGNIGTSCLDSLDRITPNTKVVLELSSWQLEDLKRIKKSPAISVITNVLKEHLNRYKNFKAYAEAKSLICAFQKKNEYCIVHTSAKAVLLPFLRKSQANVLFFQTQKKHSVRLRVSNQALRGEHNLANIEAATRVSKLLHIPNIKIKKALQNYKGLTGREEKVANLRGVIYYNDTAATMPDAAVAALRTLKPKPPASVILIAGGTDKGLDFSGLAREIVMSVSHVILFPGNATDKLKSEILKVRVKAKKIIIHDACSMKEAVHTARNLAKKGDIVLLSPGAASFGLFQNEFDRGRQFVREVLLLRKSAY